MSYPNYNRDEDKIKMKAAQEEVKHYKAVVKVFDERGGKFEIELRAKTLEKLREKIADHLQLVEDDDFDGGKIPGVNYRGQ